MKYPVIDVSRGDKKLNHYLEDKEIKRILLAFFHGVGDVVMFQEPLKKLRETYPDRHFDVGLCKGLDQEVIIPDAVLLEADWREKADELGYDLVMSCNFPMNENQTKLTKGEWCCIHELGIEPAGGHAELLKQPNRLCGVHFHITCLPDACNPDRETAEKVWNEILQAGWIPIETHFQHIFHNPINQKFDFIDCTVRRCIPRVSSLVGLIQNCGAFVGVVSGNFHVALATLPPKKVMLLEKHFKLECFTHLPASRATILPGAYKDGSIREWLDTLS
jgi:hypothetical protein